MSLKNSLADDVARAEPAQKVLEINDVIYGKITLCDHIALLAETALFKRLKGIAQLGLLPLVHESVKSSRWEHSIGTYSRAKILLDCLERNTPGYAEIPEFYRKAVEIAALLHDIGHGPFSHTWEFVCDHEYHHEENSLACIDEIFAQNGHEPSLAVLTENQNYGVDLIKALIVGDVNRMHQPLPGHYKFLFEIVNNKRCGVDVDKWDYLKRDSFHLEMAFPPDMDFEDVFLEARIGTDGDHIEYRYEDYDKIYNLFKARFLLHLHCYREPKVLACENLLHRIVTRSSTKWYGQSLCDINAITDVEAFCELDDAAVLSIIEDDEDFECLRDTDRIIALSKDEFVNIAAIKDEKFIIIKDTLQGPGVTMPSDECFQFYGNMGSNNAISRNKTSYEQLACFALR